MDNIFRASATLLAWVISLLPSCLTEGTTDGTKSALIRIRSPSAVIKERKLRRIGEISYTLLISVACANLFLIALAPEVVAVFAPSTYGEAIYVIPPLAMSVYFMFMYVLFADFEFYYSKTQWIMTASIAGAIFFRRA